MKICKQVVSMLLIFCTVIALSPVTTRARAISSGLPFTDVAESAWYRESVQYAYDSNLMTGTSPTTFEPESDLTRAMFVTILGRIDGVNTDLYSGSNFTDVIAGQWYSAYVQWAAQNGIVLGYGDGLFGTNDSVTREQMATMIARYLNTKGSTLPDSENAVSGFRDMALVSAWAQEGLELMRRTGLLTGDTNGYFYPQNTANRAEAAAVFVRLEQVINTSSDSAILSYGAIAEYTERIEDHYLNGDGYVAIDDTEQLLTEVSEYAEVLYQEGTITEYAYQPGDTCVYMQIDGWLGYLYAPPLEETLSEGSINEVQIFTVEPFAYELATQFSYLMNGLNGPDEAASKIERTFGAPVVFDAENNYDNADVTIEMLFNIIQPNSIIMWNGHGGYNSEFGSILSLGQFDRHSSGTLNRIIALYNYLFNDNSLMIMNSHLALTPVFFEKHVANGALTGSLIYLNACNSFTDTRLAQSLWDLGARCVIGNSSIVWTPYGLAMMFDFFEGLTQLSDDGDYNTVSEALAYAKSEEGQYDPIQGGSVCIAYRDDFTLPDMISYTALNNLVGTYSGSYFASQGETGLTLTVYQEDGSYKALFDFYNLPGRSNAKAGKYYMDVTATADGFRLTATDWIEQPSGYAFLNLEGELVGDVFSGTSPTKFSVTRVSGITDNSAPAIHYYKIFDNTADTWEEAQLYCASLGGHLATLTSQEENDYVYQKMLDAGYASAYFGLSDKDLEGTWVWITGEAVNYQNWHSSEPNSENSHEDYAMFYYKYSDGTWNDGDFGENTVSGGKAFICEWETAEAYNSYLASIRSSGPYTIGICQLGPHPALDAAAQGFQDALTDQLGNNVTVYTQIADYDFKTCTRIASGFVSDGCDLIMASSTPALQATISATSQIPILGTCVSNYALALETDSWTGKTGINVSGTTDLPSPDDQADLILEMFPDAGTVGVLYCSADPGSAFQISTIMSCLESRGYSVRTYAFSDSGDIAAVTASACRVCDVLYMPYDTTATADSCSETINSIAMSAGIPIVVSNESMCASCGVATLSVDYYALGYATGEMAYDILVNGADISQMNVRYSPSVTKIYNPAICEALGITVPDGYTAIDS